MRTLRLDCAPRQVLGCNGEAQSRVCRFALMAEARSKYGEIPNTVAKGDIWLWPVEAGICGFQPSGTVTLLEIAIA
jgi:hypothetical protein